MTTASPDISHSFCCGWLQARLAALASVPRRTVCPHTARFGTASAALPDGLSRRLATKACEISGLGAVRREWPLKGDFDFQQTNRKA